MKTRTFLLSIGLLLSALWVHADETVTVTATSSDISENLDLKTVATLFGQAKNLEQFENMLNNPDSAFSNLDLNGDGQVDYLRVIETADGNRHLVVIQAVLAKDVYQDVASIYVEKDPETESVTVQVIGDEYIYGTNYIIEPVYIYRPYIYDWFWGPDWVCWYSPWYWDYWPHWWHAYYCVAPYLYWDHCYWHHYYNPICSYRTGYRPHEHYRPMYASVSRSDYAARHPERSFSTRNATRGVSNARAFEAERRNSTRSAVAQGASTRSANTGTASRSFGSANIRTRSNETASSRSTVASTASRSNASSTASTRSAGTSTSRSNGTSVSTRTASTPTRTSSATTTRSSSVATPTRAASSSTSATRTTTTTSTATRTSTTATPTRSYNSSASPSRSSGSSMRSSSSSSSMRSSSSAGSMRSSGSSSGGGYSGGSRSSGGSSSRSSGSTRR